jgi:hypothetical protein
MKRLKIYFAAAIRGGRTDAARYQQLIALFADDTSSAN